MVSCRLRDEHDAGPLSGEDPRPTSGATSSQLFREEALRHFASTSQSGALLRLPRWWLHATAWLMTALVLASTAFMVFGSVATYRVGRGAFMLQPNGSQALIAHFGPDNSGSGQPQVGNRLAVRRELSAPRWLTIDSIGTSVAPTAAWPCGERPESPAGLWVRAVVERDGVDHGAVDHGADDHSAVDHRDSVCHEVWFQAGRRSAWAALRERVTR